MSGPKRSEHWGLTACRADLECAVCAKLIDQQVELQRLRDCYCEGIPELMLAEMFNVPFRDLHRHCWQHGWTRRRSWNQPALKRIAERLVWERLAKSWHLVSPTSADRMLALLVKLAGRGRQGAEEGTLTPTWERCLEELHRQEGT